VKALMMERWWGAARALHGVRYVGSLMVSVITFLRRARSTNLYLSR
jgi:hypothetical protein